MIRCAACPVPTGVECESERRNSPSQCLHVAGSSSFAEAVRLRSLDLPPPVEMPPRPPGPIVGPPWPSPGRRVILRTFLNDYSGFGRFGVWLGKSLEAAGVPVGYDVICEDERFREVGDWQRSRVVPDAPDAWRLQAHYLGYPIAPGKASVYFSMAETSRLLPSHVAELNKSRAVVVPCKFNKEGFEASGVTVPIHVVNPGVAPEEGFTFIEGQGATRTDGVFRILFAGMLQHGGMRKGIREAIEGFQLAFPTERDVELILKLWPTCVPHAGPIPDDPRIRLITSPYTTEEMGDLYRSCTVLLAPTRGEGWGLHTHEAMACGVVPIIPLASGTADFVADGNGFPIDFDWRPAEGYYAGMGDWHVPRMDSIVHWLRRAYTHRVDVAVRGENAARAAASFTWGDSGQRLKSVLQEVGMLALERPLPSLAAMAANFVGAATRHVVSGMHMADDATRDARLAICHDCPEWRPSDNRCSRCGCGVAAKAALASSTCPIGKW